MHFVEGFLTAIVMLVAIGYVLTHFGLANENTVHTAKSEPREMERRLAYECALGDIGSECFGRIVDGKQWFETNIPPDEKLAAFAQERVDLAVEYLGSRGLIERHPSKPWVHVMEMPA